MAQALFSEEKVKMMDLSFFHAKLFQDPFYIKYLCVGIRIKDTFFYFSNNAVIHVKLCLCFVSQNKTFNNI